MKAKIEGAGRRLLQGRLDFGLACFYSVLAIEASPEIAEQ